MTNPVKQLLNDLETSIMKNNYNQIIITLTDGSKIYTVIEDITYATRYFFKILIDTGEVWVNINNLKTVELR